MKKIKQLEKELLQELSIDKAWKNLEWLAEVGERLAGSPENEKTVEWIKKTLASEGVQVDVYQFDGVLSFPVSAQLKLLYPESKEIDCVAYAQSGSTLPEGIEGELVYLGAGGDEDYKGKDVKGKIILSACSYSPPRPYQAFLAERHGAKALIQFNWGVPARKVFQLGTVKAVWGLPTTDNIDQMCHIPAMSVTRATGEYLVSLCQKGMVRAWLRNEATREWMKTSQPIATVKGAIEKDKHVLTGGHIDAWGGGVSDNGSGTAILMELARVFTKLKSELRRGLKVGFWQAHETGIMQGSAWYVDNFWDDLMKNAICYINVDSVGIKGSYFYSSLHSKELDRFETKETKEILGPEEWKKVEEIAELTRGLDVGQRPTKVADNGSFFGVGVPVMDCRLIHSPEELIRENWAILGWFYQSIYDTLENTDKKELEKILRKDALTILHLCNTPILPVEFFSTAEEIKDRLAYFQKEAKDRFDLKQLVAKADELRKQAVKLDEDIAKLNSKLGVDMELEPEKFREVVAETNDCLMKLSRVLDPISYTKIGRYGYDHYGGTYANKCLPPLLPVVQLGQMTPGIQEFTLLKNKLVQERNRVSDALEDAIWVASRACKEIKRHL
jgi:hypothetical protein